MKTLFRILLAAGLLLFCLVNLTAFDWGVVVDNRSTVNLLEGEDTENEQRNKISVWGEKFWTNESGTEYVFSFNGFFLYDYDSIDEDDALIAGDTDLLRLKVKKSGLFGNGAVLDASAGRFRFSDPTRIILSHTADGAAAGLDLNTVQLKTAVGYTGLQLKPEASITMTAADAVDDEDDDVYFAPKRLFEQLDIVLPNVLPGQRVTAAGLFQQDLRDEDDTLSSVHLIGAADGEIVTGLFYALSGGYAINLDDDVNGLMGSASVYYFSEELLYSRISAGVLGADEDFFPVSTPTLGLVFTPGIANLTRIAFDYSLRPWGDEFDPVVKNLRFSVGSKIFMFDGEYIGTEYEGGIRFKPTSDFGASLTGGLYQPDEGDLAGLVRLDVSLGL